MKTINRISALLLCLVLSSGVAVAQKDKIIWSQEFKEASGDKMGNILYDDGENVYMYVQNKKRGDKGITPGIMKLDSKMKAVQRQDFKASEDDVKLLNITYCGGKFIMITTKHNKESNTTTVYGTTISLPDLVAAEGSTELWKVSAPAKRDIYLSVQRSDDTTMFAIRSFLEQKKNEKQMFAFKVMDSSFKVVQEKSKTLDYTEEQYSLKTTSLANDGSMSYHAKRYKSTSKKETTKGDDNKKQASYTLNILNFSKDGNEKEFNVELGDKLMDNLAVANDPVSSDLILFITFTDIKVKHLTGYDFLRISSTTGEVLAQKSHQFPKQMIEKMRKVEKPFSVPKDQAYLPKTFNIDEVHATADGRIYLTLENTFSVTRSSSRSSYTVYYAIGMIAMMHDKDGNVKWTNYVPKSQWYRSTLGYLYPTIAYTEDKVIIFYNDHVKNQALDINNVVKPPAPFNSLNEMQLIAVEIDNNGKANRKVVQNSEKGGVPAKAFNCAQGAGNRFILYGETFKDNRYKIGVYKL